MDLTVAQIKLQELGGRTRESDDDASWGVKIRFYRPTSPRVVGMQRLYSV